MIQSNELMIGNWLEYFTDFGDSLGFRKIKAHEFLSIHDNPKRVKPIPLTEEILLRCGFEKVEVEIDDYYDCSYEKQLNSDVFISYADDFSCSLFGDKCDSLKAYGVLPDWQSTNTVHGLQNLHHILTGQELKIEL